MAFYDDERPESPQEGDIYTEIANDLVEIYIDGEWIDLRDYLYELARGEEPI